MARRTSRQKSVEWIMQQESDGGRSALSDCEEILKAIEAPFPIVRKPFYHKLVINIPITAFNGNGEKWEELNPEKKENVFGCRGTSTWHLLCAVSDLVHYAPPAEEEEDEEEEEGTRSAFVMALDIPARGSGGKTLENTIVVEKLTDGFVSTTGFRVWIFLDAEADDPHDILCNMLWPHEKKGKRKPRYVAKKPPPQIWEEYKDCKKYKEFLMRILAPATNFKIDNSSDINEITDEYRLSSVLSMDRAFLTTPSGTCPAQSTPGNYREGRFPMPASVYHMSSRLFSPFALWITHTPPFLHRSASILKATLTSQPSPYPEWMADGFDQTEKEEMHRITVDIARECINSSNYDKIMADVRGVHEQNVKFVIRKQSFAYDMKIRNDNRETALINEYGSKSLIPPEVVHDFREAKIFEFYTYFMKSPAFPEQIKPMRSQWASNSAVAAWRPKIYPSFFGNLSIFGNSKARHAIMCDRIFHINFPNFPIFERLRMSIRGSARLNLNQEVNTNLLLSGDTAAGKSYCTDVACSLCFNGSYETMSHQTRMALTTGRPNYDKCTIYHEANREMLGMDVKGNAVSSDPALALMKARLTDPIIRTRSMFCGGKRDGRGGGRTEENFVALVNGTIIAVTNDPVDAKCALINRFIEDDATLERRDEAHVSREANYIILDINHQPDSIKNPELKENLLKYKRMNHWISYIIENAIKSGAIPDVDLRVADTVITRLIFDARSRAEGIAKQSDRKKCLYLTVCRTLTIEYVVELLFFSELSIVKDEATFNPIWLLRASELLVCTEEIAIYAATLLQKLWIPLKMDPIFRRFEIDARMRKDASSAWEFENGTTKMLPADSMFQREREPHAQETYPNVLAFTEDATKTKTYISLARAMDMQTTSNKEVFSDLVRSLSTQDPNYIEVYRTTRGVAGWFDYLSEKTYLSTNVIQATIRDLKRKSVKVKAKKFAIDAKTLKVSLVDSDEHIFVNYIKEITEPRSNAVHMGFAVQIVGIEYKDILRESIKATRSIDDKVRTKRFVTAWPHKGAEQSLCEIIEVTTRPKAYVAVNPKTLSQGHLVGISGIGDDMKLRTSVHTESTVNAVVEDMNSDKAAIMAYRALHGMRYETEDTPEYFKAKSDEWWENAPEELVAHRELLKNYPDCISEDIAERDSMVRTLSKIVEKSDISALPADFDTRRSILMEQDSIVEPLPVETRYDVHASFREKIEALRRERAAQEVKEEAHAHISKKRRDPPEGDIGGDKKRKKLR